MYSCEGGQLSLNFLLNDDFLTCSFNEIFVKCLHKRQLLNNGTVSTSGKISDGNSLCQHCRLFSQFEMPSLTLCEHIKSSYLFLLNVYPVGGM